MCGINQQQKKFSKFKPTFYNAAPKSLNPEEQKFCLTTALAMLSLQHLRKEKVHHSPHIKITYLQAKQSN